MDINLLWFSYTSEKDKKKVSCMEQGSDPEEKNIDKNLISNTNFIEESSGEKEIPVYKNIINFWDGNQNVLFYEYLLLFNKYVLFIPIIIIILFIILMSFCNNVNYKLNAAAFIVFNLVFVFYLYCLFIYSKNALCNFYLYQCVYISDLWPLSISFGIDNVNIFFI